jgi:hypothetical protein
MGSVSSTAKKITWDQGSWNCEDLTLTVKYTVGNQEHVVPILPKDVSIQFDPAWLESGDPQPQADKSLIVPVRVKPDALISPPGPEGPVEYRIGAEEDIAPAPPSKRIQVKVMVAVQIRPASLVDAFPVAGIPIVMPMMQEFVKVPSNLPPLPPLRGTATYVDEPPQIEWQPPNEDFRVRLSGKQDPQPLELHGAKDLPPGWLSSATVIFAICGKSKKLELSLETQPLDCTEGELARVVEFASSRLCLFPVGDTPCEDSSHASIQFAVITTSPWLGTQVREMELKAQALEVALFFEDTPADRLDWNKRASLAVVSKSREDNPSGLSQLRVWLKRPPGWDPPRVHWELREDDSLGDRFAPPDGAESMYVAPARDPWVAADRPASRTVLCLVGDGEGRQPEPVPEHEGLFFYMPLESTVVIGEGGKKKLHLRVRIRPSELGKLNLQDPAVKESFVKEFYLDINMQEGTGP